MASSLQNVCVFCGSYSGSDPSFILQARELGALFVENNIGLVYGGGSAGIMGAVAESVQERGGKVLGILPKVMAEQYPESLRLIGETVLAEDMHTRKRIMNARSDAFVALPGGLGTLEELLECATWSQLGIHAKPVVVLNTDGFYDPLRAMLEKAAEKGFIKRENLDIIVFCSSAKGVVEALKGYAVPEGRHAMKWKSLDDAGNFI